MRSLLRGGDGSGVSSAAPSSTPLAPPPSSTDTAGPNFMLGLLVLVGVCAFLGTAWIVFRLVFACCRPAGAALAAVPAARERALRRAALSGAPSSADLESGLYSRSGALDAALRTDSMVTRASAWARAILAGEAPPSPAPLGAPSKAGTGWDPVAVPVKHAVVVVQPTGEAFLGVTSDAEELQRDVMIQVDEAELLRLQWRLPRRQRDPELAPEGAAAESGGEDEEGRSEDGSDVLTARSSSGELAAAESGPEENAAGAGDRSQRRRRRRRLRRGTCEVACQTE